MRWLWSSVLALAALVVGCGQGDPQIVGTHPTLPVMKPGGVPGSGDSTPAPKPKPVVQ
jgi:hypothetical protein